MNKTTAATAVKFLDEGPGVIEGYASTFGPPPDRVGDVIMPGAFGISSYQVPLLAYHEAKLPIGVAVHTPDQYGLHTRATLANTAFAQEQRELFKVGAIPAFSIGYDFKDASNKRNDHGGWDLYAIDHMETSGVPIPANRSALVTMAKSMGFDPGQESDLAAEFVAFVKAGARNAMSDQQALDLAHDAIVKAGAMCAPESKAALSAAIATDKARLLTDEEFCQKSEEIKKRAMSITAEDRDRFIAKRLEALASLRRPRSSLSLDADLLAHELEELK